MSVEAIAAVLHHSAATGTAKLVLIGIANHDGDGGSWPSLATLAKYANVDPRNVRAAITRLVELGEVEVDQQGGGTHRTADHLRPNLYRVLVRCPADCDGTTQHRPRQGGMPASGGDVSIRGGGMPASGGGGMPASPEPSLEPTGNARGEVQRSTTERAPADREAPRPLSAQARETLRVREEQQAARDRAVHAVRQRPKLLVPPTARQRTLLERCRPGRSGLVRGKDTDVLLARGWVRYEGDREDVVLLTDAGLEVIGPEQPEAASG